MDALVALLHEDATLSMPPYPLWLQGPETSWAGWPGPGHDCAGSRCIPVRGQRDLRLRPVPPSPGARGSPGPCRSSRCATVGSIAINSFLDTDVLFPLFGLPEDPDQPLG